MFVRYDDDVIRAANAGADYGLSFTDPDFARSWFGNRGLEVASQDVAGLRGWQDVMVLKKVG